jgi:biotin carboxylase
MKPVEGSGIRGLRKVRERDHLQKVCKDTKKIGQTEMTANQEEPVHLAVKVGLGLN